MEECKLCNLKENDCFHFSDISGNILDLSLAVSLENNKFYLVSWFYHDTIKAKINYCPLCGRKLKEEC